MVMKIFLLRKLFLIIEIYYYLYFSGNSDFEGGSYRKGTRQSKRLAKDKSPSPTISSSPVEFSDVKGNKFTI